MKRNDQRRNEQLFKKLSARKKEEVWTARNSSEQWNSEQWNSVNGSKLELVHLPESADVKVRSRTPKERNFAVNRREVFVDRSLSATENRLEGVMFNTSALLATSFGET
jgi:hypothetical protein